MSPTNEPPPPVVCTLSLGKRSAQQLEWSDLVPLALTREAVDGGVESTYPLALADQIEELAEREISCCGSWLIIKHERRHDDIRIELTTHNVDGVTMIRSFSGL
jgi:hypothetical protein